jgi:hypothetical protein
MSFLPGKGHSRASPRNRRRPCRTRRQLPGTSSPSSRNGWGHRSLHTSPVPHTSHSRRWWRSRRTRCRSRRRGRRTSSGCRESCRIDWGHHLRRTFPWGSRRSGGRRRSRRAPRRIRQRYLRR